MGDEQITGPQPPSRRRRTARWAVAAVVVNFLAFVLFSWAVGGTAIHGMIDQGAYYLADQSRAHHTRVSPGLFYFSEVWGWVVIGSIGVLLGAFMVLRRGDS